jgi:hypothetical protein
MGEGKNSKSIFGDFKRMRIKSSLPFPSPNVSQKTLCLARTLRHVNLAIAIVSFL